ncbi:cytochrome P450 2D4-like isoform X2 [Branchiostoma lanceolatum]|uniref:cytochrome P450 2D4-like isoform X2 n=1 Tax=Branchiostoma lanceolatum TaxID=7740 RepID=UPI00345399AF
MAAGTFALEIFQLYRLNFQTFLVFCLVFLLASLYLRRPGNLPPYPPGWWPVLGHLLALGRAPHRKLTEWRRQYGDVFTVRMGMTDVVVMNGYPAVKDAVVYRSELFASRPPSYIFDACTGFGKAIGGGRWGDEMKQTLGMKMGTGSVEESIREEAGCLCDKVMGYGGKSFDIERDLQVTIGNIICSMIFGNRFDHNDEGFKGLLGSVKTVMSNFSAAQLVTVFPFLRFVPGLNGSVSSATYHARKIQKFILDEIVRHQQNLDHENPRDFIDLGLTEVETQGKVHNFTVENVMYIAQDFFLAGIDTTTTALRWGLLYMAMNTDIQERVQEEIDAVVGGALPALSHRSQLPYTEACLMEAPRIRTAAPFGLPHATTQSVAVGGLHIPAGTSVLMNLYSIHMDPAYWPDPDRFDPNRFLDKEGRVISKPDAFMPFSGGRRGCPGDKLAKMELFLIFTALLQNITFKLPEGVASYSTEGEYQGTLRPPESHKLCAIPR